MIIKFKNTSPKIHASCFISSSCDIIGDVEISNDSSIWFQVVLRGDILPIQIGRRTNIQDHSLLHTSPGGSPTVIGDDVTIGHHVIIHGACIKDRVLIGMGTTVLDDVEVGHDSIVGANSLITKGTIIPPGSLILGSPAKVIRHLTPDEIASIQASATGYVQNAANYTAEK